MSNVLSLLATKWAFLRVSVCNALHGDLKRRPVEISSAHLVIGPTSWLRFERRFYLENGLLRSGKLYNQIGHFYFSCEPNCSESDERKMWNATKRYYTLIYTPTWNDINIFCLYHFYFIPNSFVVSKKKKIVGIRLRLAHCQGFVDFVCCNCWYCFCICSTFNDIGPLTTFYVLA